MSIGNLKDQGNKGNNFPYQLKTLQLLGAINDSISALPGVDHESRTSTYQAINNGIGYSIGDIIIRYDIIDLGTGLIDSTIWFNDTLQTQITPAPLPGDLTPVSAPTGVTVLNGPAGAAVNIQDGGNSITIDNVNIISKINRIKGSDNYNRAISYVSAGTGDFRVSTIVYTGTTALGAETITETFTYYLTTDNVTNIQYS